MKDELILQGERLDYLECKDLSLIQFKDGYTFTADAVLLANFAKALPGDRVVDLGTGSGVVPILMSAKTMAKELIGVELQPRLADMAKRSVEYNGLEERVKILNANMKDCLGILGEGNFDVCTSNPPYKVLQKIPNQPSERDICKSEITITLDELVGIAAKLLRYGGRFFVIIKGERLVDLMSSMRKHLLEPKRMVAVQPKADKNVDTILVEGKKGARPGMVFEKPLIIYNEDGTVTQEAKEKYHQ